MIYLILLSCFVLRAIPRCFLRNSYVSDSYFHLYCASVIRNNAFRLPDKLPRIVLEHEYTYPFLYHYLLAIFPIKIRLWIERTSGAFFDTISVSIVYVFSCWVFQEGRLPYLAEMAAGLYSFSPALLRLGSGPRAYNGSPRTMAQTLYFLHITTAFIGIYENSMAYLAVSVISGAVLTLTAKFGTQVLVIFGVVFMSLVSPIYGLILAGSFILSIVVGRGKAIAIFGGHMRHSSFYAKFLQRIFLFPHIRSIRAYLKTLLYETYRLVRYGKVRGFLDWLYSEPFYLHILITAYPQFLLMPYYFRIELNGPNWFLVTWSVAALSAFFLTRSVKPLLFLGEGERYLEYALVPSIILFVRYFSGWNIWVIYLLIIYSSFSSIYFIFEYFRRFAPIDRNYFKTEELFRSLQTESEGVTLPIGSFHWQTLYRSTVPVITIGGNINEKILPRDTFMRVFGNFPYPSSNLRRILREYKVRYIISDKDSLNHYRRIMNEPGLFGSKIKIYKEASTLKLFKVDRE